MVRRRLVTAAASLTWIVGALAAAWVGVVHLPHRAVFVLAAAASVTLLILSRRADRRAATTVSALVLLQFPFIVTGAVFALQRPLVDFARPYHPYAFLVEHTIVPGFVAVLAMAVPVASAEKIPDAWVARYRHAIRLAWLLAAAASLALVLLAMRRLSQQPPIGEYIHALPIHTIVPDPATVPCSVPASRSAWHTAWIGGSANCETLLQPAAPLEFQYACSDRLDGGRVCMLFARNADGVGTEPVIVEGGAGAVLIHRDLAHDRFFARQADQTREVAVWYNHLLPRDVSADAAPPVEWVLLSAAGLGVALLLAVAAHLARLRERRLRGGCDANLHEDGALSSNEPGGFSADDGVVASPGLRPGPVVVLAHRLGPRADYRRGPGAGHARVVPGTQAELIGSLERLRGDLACVALAVLVATNTLLFTALLFGFVV